MNCKSTDNLHIHHINYTGKYPWDVSDNDLICLCNECHKKAHTGELTNLKTIIGLFDISEDDKTRVMCFKNNNFIGNYALSIAADVFELKEKGIIKCCEGLVKSCGGYMWKYPKVGQRIETSTIYESPKNTREYINFILGQNPSCKCTEWESNFINSLYKCESLTMKQKIILVKIINKKNDV